MADTPNSGPPPDTLSSGGFEELVADHQKRIYFFIRSMVFQPEDAGDILQDVNLILIRKREKFKMGTDFKSWAFAIARFECLAYLSRRKKTVLQSLDTGVLESLADRAEERADDVEPWLRALEECRRGLPDESARLLSLRYQHQVMLETIAAQWQTSVGALKQKLLRIRIQLKNCILKRRGKEITGNDGFCP
ncbi:sigma-70 family RNA polymerase sigma factor [Luteolibacter ambystomatis]|uniref:Sigma-70 family RNA polymerase sigma factor n=1 Tax=Luteolibacter ambystomatis TaxID=2824561 RepID=A0A975G5T8_9BACT|nr:sigma-70 family RNA polymerase sigma factor [Luteolibacter ambystomatis]QUE49342.1 sigma-70 family RNA polymerase sigma factor [Luteolibacter ambystomatis]